MVTAAVTVSLPRAVVVLEVEALEAGAGGDAADVGRMLRSSTTSSFSVVSTTVSDSTDLPTTDPIRPMSACWRRKYKSHAGGSRARPGWLLRGYHDKLGLRFQTYRQWIASGAQVPRPEKSRVNSAKHD